ncbi:unnamed protein product [Rotaria sp. Silwood1]|nr:unnamed protein product [Rotaria sp. Silwood1]CAF4575832.1 unnamed protein product [Rotaria sp. Silwood1]
MQQHISPAAGEFYGMLILEGHSLCKAVWYTFKKYRKDPQVYGLNQWNERQYRRRPVLILHGAIGSWSYLGDLAVLLKSVHIPVFVINLGFGLPTEETRKRVFDKIEEIRKLYYDSYQKLNNETHCGQIDQESLGTMHNEISTMKLQRTWQENKNIRITTNTTSSNTIPLVDIVAHSIGGNLALYSAFTQDCSYIDVQGNLKFRSAPQPNLHVGKIITVALPSNQIEINCMREINKLDNLFNVNAEFDALMAYKKCALAETLPSNVKYIDAGHIGIVFNRSTYSYVLQFLLK